MANTYTVDGTEASIAPFSVQWIPQRIGTDHQGAPIYADKEHIMCRFPPASPTMARQWVSTEDGESHNITMLGPNSTQFFDLSAVYVTVTEPPFMSDIHSSEFAITITNATRPTIT